MRVKRVLYLFFAVLFLLPGCVFDISAPYTFRQSKENIVCIEILTQINEQAAWDDRFEVVNTLDTSLHNTFIDRLASIKGQNFINPPSTSFDLYVICITYADGEKEYISSCNNGYRLPGGEIQLDTYWFSDKEGFDALIAQYMTRGRST